MVTSYRYDIISGFSLATGRPRAGLVGAKTKRTPLIAANARAAELDTAFYAVQTLELIAGAANIVLLGFNMRDGLKMTGRLRRAGYQAHPFRP